MNAEEYYQNWDNQLQDHFTQLTKDQTIPVEELMVLDQFLAWIFQDLQIWL